jgi:20S proteasome alpha/beta subunit
MIPQKPRPEPRPPNPKPKRLPERHAVTIIAGFKCSEGIVLCADTQETVSNLSKRSVPKIRFEPSDAPHQGDSLAAAFCGAGDNGPFIDKIVETAWKDAQTASSPDEACQQIEQSIKDTYLEFGQIFQPGYCPTAQLIYGVKMNGVCRLFSASGPVIVEKKDYDSLGAGYYMADFLTRRMYEQHLTLRQCVILVAYILFQAKEHVDGCGGESHIAVLREKGVSGRANWKHVNAITELVEWADGDVGRLLLNAADIEMTSKQFTKDGKQIIHILDLLRGAAKRKLDEDDLPEIFGIKRAKTDFLGLPLPSDEE